MEGGTPVEAEEAEETAEAARPCRGRPLGAPSEQRYRRCSALDPLTSSFVVGVGCTRNRPRDLVGCAYFEVGAT